ncbi:MAG: hypothetical protein ACRDIE_09920, partial [Chloroflexota bacterium]
MLASRAVTMTALVGLALGQAASVAASAGDLRLPGAPGCPIFPASNVWNRDISHLPVAADSTRMIAAIGLGRGLHPDFSHQGGYGIPFQVVSGKGKASPVTFDYADESDQGPYPIPARPLIEGGSDRHMLLIDSGNCSLYELYDAQHTATGWHAGSGAIWNLRSNALRPAGWTSADAAGLPIFPGLVRYDEVARGVIDHVLRFTAVRTARAHIYPARHDAGDAGAGLPPMGLRLRLKASVNIGWAGPQTRVILTALKK